MPERVGEYLYSMLVPLGWLITLSVVVSGCHYEFLAAGRLLRRVSGEVFCVSGSISECEWEVLDLGELDYSSVVQSLLDFDYSLLA